VARRVSLPAADDLFRPTSPDGQGEPPRAVRAVADSPEAEADATPRRPSGRVRHDEKMTVYVTSDELLDIEHARLVLRRSHGLGGERGRMVREALALVLADLEAHGADSALVRRLTEE
jgi:hypothetical protein